MGAFFKVASEDSAEEGDVLMATLNNDAAGVDCVCRSSSMLISEAKSKLRDRSFERLCLLLASWKSAEISALRGSADKMTKSSLAKRSRLAFLGSFRMKKPVFRTFVDVKLLLSWIHTFFAEYW